MALSGYLTLEFDVLGAIVSEEGPFGHEEQLEVIAFTDSFHANTDPAVPFSERLQPNEPFTLTRELDSASPLIVSAFGANQLVTEFRLELVRVTPAAIEETFATIRLLQARITDYRVEMLNIRYPENVAHEVREHVSFGYSELVYTYEDGGLTGSILVRR